jgi:hypothetical protein
MFTTPGGFGISAAGTSGAAGAAAVSGVIKYVRAATLI